MILMRKLNARDTAFKSGSFRISFGKNKME